MVMTANHKTLYLHIGSEKTGTTSIQVALTACSEALRRSSRAYYPVRTPLFHKIAHFPVVGAFLEPHQIDFVPPSYRVSIADVTQGLRLLAAENSGHSLILSAEHFSSRLRFPKLAFLKGVLKDALPDYSVKIIYHVRSQPSLYCSRFYTFVENFGTDWPRPQDIRSDDPYYNFHGIACEWAHAFGRDNVQVVNYHGGDALSMFSAATTIEFPSDVRSRQIVENASRSYEECRLLECFNSFLAPVDWKNYEGHAERCRLRDQFLAHLGTLSILRTPVSSMLTKGDVEHFMCEFRECNDRLQETFNLDYNLNNYIFEMANRAREGAPLAAPEERGRARPLGLEPEGKVRQSLLRLLLAAMWRLARAHKSASKSGAPRS